eukprot:2017055-Alexandrium_andersonii.AAC.1
MGGGHCKKIDGRGDRTCPACGPNFKGRGAPALKEGEEGGGRLLLGSVAWSRPLDIDVASHYKEPVSP